MVNVGNIVMTSHGPARVVVVAPGHAKNGVMVEMDVNAKPASNPDIGTTGEAPSASSSSPASTAVQPTADTAPVTSTQTFVLSVDPTQDADPVTQARDLAQASQHAYNAARHRLKNLDAAGQEQVLNLKT